MGEASRRKTAILALKSINKNWLESLSAEETIVATEALATYDKIVDAFGMTEACYNLV